MLIVLAILAGAIWFAFGARAARAIVGAVLVIGAMAFAYIMFLIVTGRI